MATSTEETVSQVIIDALKAVATTDLEFDEPEGNIKDYLLEYEQAELIPDYLMSSVGNETDMQAIGVETRARDTWHGGNQPTSATPLMKRTYTTRIFFYVSAGVRGEGYKKMIRICRKTRGAIRLLSSNLSNTVDYVTSTGEISVDKLSGVDPIPGELLVGQITYVSERANPDF